MLASFLLIISPSDYHFFILRNELSDRMLIMKTFSQISKSFACCFLFSLLPILILLLAACGQSTSGTKVNTIAPTKTATATFTMTPTMVHTNTPTAIPTLPIEQARARLLELLANNGDCRLHIVIACRNSLYKIKQQRIHFDSAVKQQISKIG